ncbi:MAG: 50S ribosomal protein L10 [Tepidisphaeraceae bacterium]|jgi:ribosomal protein L10
MSKKVKSLIEKELAKKFDGVEALAVISPRGISGLKNNQLRRKLREKGVRMTVVKNTLVKRATQSGKLKGFQGLLDGPSALVYGKSSISTIARLLVEAKKSDEKLELRGIFFDGEVYIGDKGVEQVSKFPTREEAIALIAAAIAAAGRRLAGAVASPARRMAGVIKSIEEKAKAKEAAAPVPAPGS